MAKVANVSRPLTSAVGKKVLMALTGLLLCIYLVGHLLGNLTLLTGAGGLPKFNAYAHFLTSIPILPLIELGLLAIFLIHIYEAIVVVLENKSARPHDYHMKVWARQKNEKSRKSVSSSTMIWTGIVIVVFVALHVKHFKYGPAPDLAIGTGTTAAAAGPGTSAQQAQEQMRDLGFLVVSEFKKPWITGLYVFAMLCLGLHLYHAVSSAFQSLGLSNKRLEQWILVGGKAFTVLIAGGFALIPIWIYVFSQTPTEPETVVRLQTPSSRAIAQNNLEVPREAGR